jgi:hypothetical protein
MSQRPIEYTDAIYSLYPKGQWTLEENNLEKLSWFSADIQKPSSPEIEEELQRLILIREQQELAKEQAKASAQAKLEALGLTKEEVLAFIGDVNNGS